MKSGWHRPVGYGGRLSEALYRGDDWVVRVAREGFGRDISRHVPEDLLTVDRFLDEQFRDRAKKSHRTYVTTVVWMSGYLGEVVIKNLGGWWHFPDVFQLAAMLPPGDRLRRLERYCYVAVGRERIRVLKASQEAIESTSAKVSLYKIYQGWERLAALPHSSPRTGPRID